MHEKRHRRGVLESLKERGIAISISQGRISWQEVAILPRHPWLSKALLGIPWVKARLKGDQEGYQTLNEEGRVCQR